MQALHDQNDNAGLFIVEAAGKGMVEPAVGALAPVLVHGLRRIERVVYDEEITALPGQRAAHGRGEAEAAPGRHEFMFLVLVARQLYFREQRAVPRRSYHAAAIQRMLERQR